MTQTFKVGNIVEAQVSRITDFGAFVKIDNGNVGLIHISQIADDFVKDINEHLKVGEQLKVRVIKIGPGKKIDLSLKQPAESHRKNDSGFKSSDFEQELEKFLQTS